MIRINENYDLKYIEEKINKNAVCIFKKGRINKTRVGIVEKVKNTLSLHINESFYDWYIILFDYNKNAFNPHLYDII